MVTKNVICFLVVISITGVFGNSCQNPKVEASSFTSLDATVVTQVAYITEFTLKCDNGLAENYALYAEVDGKSLTAARIGGDKYQVCITFHSTFTFGLLTKMLGRMRAVSYRQDSEIPVGDLKVRLNQRGMYIFYVYNYFLFFIILQVHDVKIQN